MALSTARMHKVRGRPPLLAAGITSLIHSHSSSVRSLGYVCSFIYPFYTTHEDFSDRLLDRLRDQARLGDFEAVILLSPDRLARSYPHQCLLLEEFKKYGCRVIFMENPFGDSPHGQLLAQMQGMIAEYERSQIADRTRRGRLHKARKAEFLPWAYRAYGYRYIPKQAGLPPRVEIHPEQAEVVRDMFRWLIQEQSTTRQIVKRLNALKIPT